MHSLKRHDPCPIKWGEEACLETGELITYQLLKTCTVEYRVQVTRFHFEKMLGSIARFLTCSASICLSFTLLRGRRPQSFEASISSWIAWEPLSVCRDSPSAASFLVCHSVPGLSAR